MSILQIFIGAVLALIVSLVAYWYKVLSSSGAVAAFFFGVVVFGLGGMGWALVLIAFFASSSGMSFIFKNKKRDIEDRYAKGTRRDAGQVLANGGIAGLAVLSHLIFPGSPLPWIVFCASLAAANADTWATELGVLSRTSPRLITSWKKVPVGTSGAISATGTLASLAGAILIGIFSFFFWPKQLLFSQTSIQMIATGFIIVGGFLGSLVDSLIGATLQAIYWCPVCKKETEKHPLHTCGNTTVLLKGWKKLNNDWVNVMCTASAALIAFTLSIVIVV